MCRQTIRDIWNLQTWVRATRPLWTDAEWRRFEGGCPAPRPPTFDHFQRTRRPVSARVAPLRGRVGIGWLNNRRLWSVVIWS